MDYDYPSNHSRNGILSNRHDRPPEFTQSVFPVDIDLTTTPSYGVSVSIQYRSLIRATDEIHCVEKFTGTKETVKSKRR